MPGEFMSAEPIDLRRNADELSKKLEGLRIRKVFKGRGNTLGIALEDDESDQIHFLQVEQDLATGLDGGFYGVAVIRLDGERVFNT